MTRVAIAGGTVVTASETILADVLVEDEVVVAVAVPGGELSTSFRTSAEVLDATGCYVIPGGIDAHTHLQSTGQREPVLETFETGTIAAAIGGTTTIIDFAEPSVRPMKMQEAVGRYHGMAQGRCAIDYAFHVMAYDVDAQMELDMDEMVREGVTSFKMFTAYPGAGYSPDDAIFRMMQRSASNGGLVMMHAENGPVIDVLRDQAIARGDTSSVWHSLTRPPLLEGEAVNRVATLAEVAGVPLYIVHLSSSEALDAVTRARDRGTQVFAETCPQYLFLDLDDLRKPDLQGAGFVCSPPLRPHEQQADLWRGLRNRDLHTVATDHCPFCTAQKRTGLEDFRRTPNGIPGIEHRVEQIYEGAVAEGRLGLNRWVEICSTAPAKIFGMYPRKGTIAPGSDADVVIFDPSAVREVSAATHHMNVDYSAYEGQRLSGSVTTVLSRGAIVVRDGTFVGRVGHGSFVRRDPGSFLL